MKGRSAVYACVVAAIAFALAGPVLAQQTCAQLVSPSVLGFPGATQVTVPAGGFPAYLVNGLIKAAAKWNPKCSHIPDFKVDDQQAPPPNGSNNVLRIDFRATEDAPFDANKNVFVAARVSHEEGVLTIWGGCPQPQKGVSFDFCNATGTRIAWGSAKGIAVLAHELGHTLRLDHDNCGSTSLMKEAPDTNGVILAEHCHLADSLHDVVPVRVTVSGVGAGTDSGSGRAAEGVIVSRNYLGPQGAVDFHEETVTQDGTLTLPSLPKTWSASFSGFSLNPNKTCTTTPDTVSQPTAAVDVAVACVCTSSNLEALGFGHVTTTDCPYDFPQDITKLELFLPMWPIFADPWPWYLDNFGPIFATDPENCERQTVCTEGEPVTTTIVVDGKVVTITIMDTLDCHDQCVSGASAPLHGPSTQLTLSGGDHAADGTLLVDGYAVDANGVYDLAFYVDHQRVTLSGFQRNLYRPEACTQSPAPNRVNCTSYGGFAGTLDAASFGPGTHMLQVVALDARAGYPAATLVERPFTVPSCFDTTKPWVSLIDPAEGETVRGTVEMWASASDDVGVTKVEFFVNGVRVATDTSAPYIFNWNSLTVPDGAHTVNVRAWDACGNRKWDAAPTNVSVFNTACNANATTLCLQNDRFSARVSINGSPGVALPFSGNGGFFWLSEAENVEVAVKVLDGRSVNGRFWVFHGSLTTLPYTLTLTDHSTGISRTFEKAASSLCGSADTSTFLDTSGLGFDELVSSPCTPSSTGLCLLGDRFQVRVIYNTWLPGVEVTPKTGSFGIESVWSPEVVVKVLDGRAINNRFWVFFGSLTDRFYQVEVTDTVTGISKTYNSPASFCGTADVAAF
jgi:hypothetical protein